jgi:hypothetical protein
VSVCLRAGVSECAHAREAPMQYVTCILLPR